jgi:hypothetical protein
MFECQFTVSWDGWMVGMSVCRPGEFRSNAKCVVHDWSGLRKVPEFMSSDFKNENLQSFSLYKILLWWTCSYGWEVWELCATVIELAGFGTGSAAGWLWSAWASGLWCLTWRTRAAAFEVNLDRSEHPYLFNAACLNHKIIVWGWLLN